MLGRPIELVRAGECFSLHTRPAFGPAIRVAFDIPADAKALTKLEAGVLMAIAMFQPVTRGDISEMFGREISRDLIAGLREEGLIAAGSLRDAPLQRRMCVRRVRHGHEPEVDAASGDAVRLASALRMRPAVSPCSATSRRSPRRPSSTPSSRGCAAPEWVVDAKRPFAGPKAVLAYLARYTHRVAISNSRLVALDDKGVTFKWKDYRVESRDRFKTMTLDAAEFIRRFLLHVLPAGFHRIRHYGLFAGAVRARTSSSSGNRSPPRRMRPSPRPPRPTVGPMTFRLRAAVLRRPDDHRRDVRRRAPGAAASKPDQDRHLMTVAAPLALQRLRSHSLAPGPRTTTAMASQRRRTPIARPIRARPSIRSIPSDRNRPADPRHPRLQASSSAGAPGPRP